MTSRKRRFRFAPEKRKLIEEALKMCNPLANSKEALRLMEKATAAFIPHRFQSPLLNAISTSSEVSVQADKLWDVAGGDDEISLEVAASALAPGRRKRELMNAAREYCADFSEKLRDLRHAAEEVEERARRQFWRSDNEHDLAARAYLSFLAQVWHEATGYRLRYIQYTPALAMWASRDGRVPPHPTRVNPLELILDGILAFKRHLRPSEVNTIDFMTRKAVRYSSYRTRGLARGLRRKRARELERTEWLFRKQEMPWSKH